MKSNILLDEEEFVEELEPLETMDDDSRRKRSRANKPKSKVKGANSKSEARNASPTDKSNIVSSSCRREMKNSTSPTQTSSTSATSRPDYRWDEGKPDPKDQSLSTRTRIRRSLSLDMNKDREYTFRRNADVEGTKRRSWDCPSSWNRSRLSSSPNSSKEDETIRWPREPDFRWDNPDFRWDKFGGDNSRENARPRRKGVPLRTKSDLTAYDRPGSGRGKVKFCLDNNVCIEVPRASKDMKSDLFYTKKEIKVFKAENKERKQQKAMSKLEARIAAASDSALKSVGNAPIATF